MSVVTSARNHTLSTLPRIIGDRAVVERARFALMLRYGIGSHEALRTPADLVAGLGHGAAKDRRHAGARRLSSRRGRPPRTGPFPWAVRAAPRGHLQASMKPLQLRQQPADSRYAQLPRFDRERPL